MKARSYQSTLLILTSLLSLLSAFTNTYGAPVPIIARQTITTSSGYVYTAQSIAVGLFAILSGLYFCFFGLRYFKFTMFLVGIWTFGNAVYIGMVNKGVHDPTLLIVIPVVVGVIAGLVLACCWHLGVFFLAALFGYGFALWILAWGAGDQIDSNGRIILIVVLVVAAVILMFIFEKRMIVISSSFVGAFLIIFGLDLFVQTGFAALVVSFLRNHPNPFPGTWQIYLMLVAVFLLTLIGCVVHWTSHWEVDHRKQTVAPYGYGTKWGPRTKN